MVWEERVFEKNDLPRAKDLVNGHSANGFECARKVVRCSHIELMTWAETFFWLGVLTQSRSMCMYVISFGSNPYTRTVDLTENIKPILDSQNYHKFAYKAGFPGGSRRRRRFDQLARRRVNVFIDAKTFSIENVSWSSNKRALTRVCGRQQTTTATTTAGSWQPPTKPKKNACCERDHRQP